MPAEVSQSEGHPQQEHETRHGSMSQSRWVIEGPDGTGLEVEGRRFASNDDGAPMMCNIVCQALGRHVHIDYCRSLYIRQYLDRFRQRELPVEPASTSFPAARDEIISFFIIHGYTAAAWQEKAATAHTCANPKCQLFLKSRISHGTISRHSSTPPPCSPT